MVSVNQLALRQASPLPRLRQPPLSEVEPLRELTDLRLEPEHAIFEVRHSPVRRTGPDPGIGNFPPDDPPPVAIAEIARRDDDHVVQIPDPHPAEGEAHPDAALGTASVKTVQAEHTAEDRQPESERASARTPTRAPRPAPVAPSTRSATASPMSRGGPRESGEGLERLPRDHARLPAHFPPLPEDDQRRNSADAEAMGGRGVAVGVELHDQHVALSHAREVVAHVRD